MENHYVLVVVSLFLIAAIRAHSNFRNTILKIPLNLNTGAEGVSAE